MKLRVIHNIHVHARKIKIYLTYVQGGFFEEFSTGLQLTGFKVVKSHQGIDTLRPLMGATVNKHQSSAYRDENIFVSAACDRSFNADVKEFCVLVVD